ncbi:DUF4242 domain-containing protein [Mycolicibacterium pulveris]|uniref:DUF4242 domain-containing protein n=1 Tax=Mycolicibacterium pulveris TaxID=36813 RepID=UPI003CE8CA2F
MRRFLIEREMPQAGAFTGAELAEISRKFNIAASSLGVPYRWITSYIAGDKVYCVHEADDEEVIREHSRRCGFPVHTVSAVITEFGPDTAGQQHVTPSEGANQ